MNGAAVSGAPDHFDRQFWERLSAVAMKNPKRFRDAKMRRIADFLADKPDRVGCLTLDELDMVLGEVLEELT